MPVLLLVASGPGSSGATAGRFGKEGYSVALVGRDCDRVIDGVALKSAGTSKLLGLLAERLRGDGIHVGETVINGTILGLPYATPTAIDPADVAERFRTVSRTRADVRVHMAQGS